MVLEAKSQEIMVCRF